MSEAARTYRSLPAKKLSIAAVILLFITFSAAFALAFPVAVEQVDGRVSLKNSAYYLIDPTSALSILDVSAPMRQSRFVPLADGIPAIKGGAMWLRFSLIKNNIPANAPRNSDGRSLLLELGRGAPRAKLFIAETITTEGDIKQWSEQLSSSDGTFALPEPDLLPLTIYVRLESMPSLWFEPHLHKAMPDETPFPWMLAVQILLGLALVVTLIRGMSENEEWRFWAGAILACAAVSSLYADNGIEKSMVYLTAMPQLLTPGLAIMLLPHLGRYMLASSKSKPLDYLLIFMSLPGVILALLPLVPGFGWTARLLPLAPVLLFPLLVLSIPAIRGKQKGSVCYFLFNLFPFLGGSLALACLVWPSLHPLWPYAVSFGLLGYLAGGVLMAAVKPATLKDKGDFFPLNDYFEPGGVLSDAHPASAEERASTAMADGINSDVAVDSTSNSAMGAVSEQSGSEPPQHDLPDILLPNDEDDDVLELDESLKIIADEGITPLYADDSDAGGESDALAPAENDVDRLLDKLFYKEDATPATLDDIMESDIANVQQDAPVFGAEAEWQDSSAEYKPAVAEKVIYIKDEEEPGLVILKPASPESAILADAKVAPPLTDPNLPDFDYKALDRVESALRTPYENLLRHLSELRKQQQGSADTAEGLEETLRGLGLMLDNLERLARGEFINSEPANTIFNLSGLLRQVHESMLPLAESRGITLSWFIAPGLPAFHKGDEENLSRALQFLMQGSIDAADSGAVQLTVREAAQPGQVQFTLLESGMDIKNVRRPSGWLNKAWELASASGGSFNVDFIPGQGTAISFTLALTPLYPAEGAPEQQVVVLETDISEQPEELAPEIINDPEGEQDAEIILLSEADLAQAEVLLAEEPGAEVEDAVPVIYDEPAGMVLPAEPAETGVPEAAYVPEAEQPVESEQAPAAETFATSFDLFEINGDIEPVEDAEQVGSGEQSLREYIVIADMAASGRRFIARRLDGLPHKLVEARNADEVFGACTDFPVGLIIVDADMPEVDLRSAMQDISGLLRAQGVDPIPTLCLISHNSQSERMARLGCTESQLKSASRTQFRQSVLRLCPHPDADPDEMLPESPLLMGVVQSQPQPAVVQPLAGYEIADAPVLSAEVNIDFSGTPVASDFLSEPQTEEAATHEAGISVSVPPVEYQAGPAEPIEPANAESAGKKSARVPMLDLIVASIDEEEATQPASASDAGILHVAAPEQGGQGSRLVERPYKISGTENDYMDGDMVPLIPGFLIVLEDTLTDLSQARSASNAALMQEVAARMAGQGGTYGLNALERVASCVERAAQAGDKEAMRDLSEELYLMGQRYLGSLKATHAEYMGNK